MPQRIKGVMGLAYLLARAADTLVDCQRLSAKEKDRVLKLFGEIDNFDSRKKVAEVAGKASSQVTAPGEKELLANLGEILSVYEGAEEIFRRYILDVLKSVVSGMKMDVAHFSDISVVSAFKTAKEIEDYCACIGGGPGVFWARIYNHHLKMKKRTGPDLDDARAVGEALQITNILRDISSDVKMGRCYLPLEDLKAVGVSPSHLKDKKNLSRVKPVIGKWIVWAVERLDNSENLLSSVPKNELAMRAAVIWPVFWAMDTLSEILRENPLDPDNKPRIKREKIYSTIFSSGPLLLSNTSFARGYRFRRETLIVKLNLPESSAE